MPQPPDERAADNPWPQWPHLFKQDYGQIEAEARFGKDPRTYQISTKRFVGDEHGRVKELRTVHMNEVQVGTCSSSRSPAPRKCGRQADLVLCHHGLPGRGGLPGRPVECGAHDARSNVLADHGKFRTSIEGIFSAGGHPARAEFGGVGNR